MTSKPKLMVGVRLGEAQCARLESLEREAARSRSEILRDALAYGLTLLEVRQMLDHARTSPELARSTTDPSAPQTPAV